MNGNALTASGQRPEGIAGGIGAFGNDLASLASLQAKLAGCDLRDSLVRAAPGLVALAVALLVLPAAAVVGLLGVADLIAGRWPDLSLAQARLWTAAGAAVVALALIAAGLLRIRSSGSAFRRSQEELQRNVAWIRTVLAHSGR